MKNIQVIDSAENCAYDIYRISDDSFLKIFPDGQDIEFSEDLFERLGSEEATKILKTAWENKVDKQKVSGIHGTLFYGLQSKKAYYPSKRESDLYK